MEDTNTITNTLLTQPLSHYKDIQSFIPNISEGRVIKVYDGDTITIIAQLNYPNCPLYKFNVRLDNIDCPEMKTKDPIEKQVAQIAKKTLSDLIFDKVITLKNVKTEKYGRLLATIYLDELNINEYLVKKRLAYVYDGGTKTKPTNWLEYYEGK